jgi:hypothetical protein
MIYSGAIPPVHGQRGHGMGKGYGLMIKMDAHLMNAGASGCKFDAN